MFNKIKEKSINIFNTFTKEVKTYDKNKQPFVALFFTIGILFIIFVMVSLVKGFFSTLGFASLPVLLAMVGLFFVLKKHFT